ncbi:MAG: short chain dehydrogenase [Myxococcaceae bacterium]|nr:short chain dehydrogenase [Myxococcaceae bacterium]
MRGQKCVITGAASGIGRATAQAAAAQGAVLFLTDLHAEQLEQTVGELRAQGATVALAEHFDIANYEAVQAFAQRIHRAHGSVDVVMNIAGISIWGPVEQLEHRHWRKTIEVNLMGPIHVIESFIPEMVRAGKGGHLVNVSSAAGLFGLPWHAAYSATKFGLRGISEVLRFDLKRHGISVSLVCPGGVATPLVQTVEVVGLDPARPAVKQLQQRFHKHAVTAEAAAQAILRGIAQKQYMVFTSRDIRVGYWLQRKFSLPYELMMRVLNDRLVRAAQG